MVISIIVLPWRSSLMVIIGGLVLGVKLVGIGDMPIGIESLVFVGRACCYLHRPIGCPPFVVVLDGIGFFVGGADSYRVILRARFNVI